ncbi:MAG: NAD-dependent epimerase/dehydratase family protein [Ferrovibrio sp.]|uniref:NAD-dependent epimerase/dehydratase family protein n=1 Tax=Ferrovibrio sp. TaxID=1917215 RepID=UPI00391A1077
MRVIVTGASGFLGSAIVRKLTTAGIECLGVSRKTVAGLNHVAEYSDTPEGDVLIHLAETSDRAAAKALGDSVEVEARHTLDALLAKGYRKIVYASSAVLYGDRWLTPRKTSDPVEAQDIYTRIKLASEQVVLAHGGAVARLANLYGPGMATGNVLSHILGQLDHGSTITMQTLEPVRDFLWVEDAADALSRMAIREATGLFNVGSGIGTSIAELVDQVQTVAATSQKVVAMHKLEQPSYLVLDVVATKQALDWKPETVLQEGLRKLLKLKIQPEVRNP